jgi:hypothetical protein
MRGVLLPRAAIVHELEKTCSHDPRCWRDTLTNRRATGLGVLVSALLICSCGGSNSPAPTKARFVSRANAICAVGLRSAARLKTPRSPAELLLFSERASSIVSKAASELKNLNPPSSSRVAYERFLTTLADEARLNGDVVAALRAGNAARARAALKALNSNSVNEEARALGLTECARTVTPG